MIDILLCIVLTALLVNGLEIATGHGMLLNFIRRWLDAVFVKTHKITLQHDIDRGYYEQKESLPKPIVSKIYYPILYCIRCMPSLWGFAVCMLFLPHTMALFYIIPVVVLCSVCLSTIINQQFA